MSEPNICLRHQRSNAIRHLYDIIYTVINIVNLSAASHLTADCFANHLFIKLHHVGLYRNPIKWGLLKHTHVADPDQAHMQRPWDWRCCQCQNIHVFFQILDFFLMGYTETLFLVNNQKAQILKLDIFRQYPVCADQNINLALFQILKCPSLLCRCAKPAQQVNPNREILHSLGKCIVVLLCKNCSRNKEYNLFTVLYRLKRRSYCDLCLPIAHISANQTIHDFAALHILLDCINCSQLVLSLFKRKHLFEFPLPDTVSAESIPICLLTDRIQSNQIFCNIFYGPANLALCFIPFLPAKLVQSGCPYPRTGILL